jgi:glycosyltransferase involved in cell wall biosynthesis
VLAQSYFHFELIIVDDGSTDDSETRVSRLDDQRIRFIKYPHSGHTGIVRNRGAGEAKGEWLAFLDSDDLWVTHKLELQLKAIKRSGALWCFGNYEHFGSTQRKRKPVTAPDDLTVSILLNTTAVFIGTMLVRKDVFMLLGGFNETGKLRFRDDFEFALRLSLHSKPAFVEEVLTLVREHPERSTNQLDRSFEYTFNAYEEFIRTQKAGSLRELARSRQAYLLSEAAANKKTAIKFLQRIKLLKTSFSNDRLPHWLHCFWRTVTRG